MRCIHCNEEFEAKRSTAKYCSAKCRKLAFLRPEVAVLDENAKNAKPVLLTVKDGKLDADLPDIEVDVNLPDCVPFIIANRYARGEPEYMNTIDRLLVLSLTELEAKSIWIPCWRHHAGQEAPDLALAGLKE